MSPDRASGALARDVVLLHGWATDAGVWEGLASALARNFRVHAVNLPDYRGKSSRAPQSLAALAQILAQDMPCACHVVGWSLGALIALAWARSAPEQVSRLALVSATPCFTRRSGWTHGLQDRVLQVFAERLDSGYDDTMRRFIALQVLGDTDARSAARALWRHVPAHCEASLETMHAGLRILREEDLRGALAHLRQPALVLHGEHDRLIPVAAGRYLGARIAGARFEIVEGAAHAPFLSKPPAVSRRVMEFFDG